jgi:hypothetical protein
MLKAMFNHQMAKHAMSGRAAADIAHAQKQHTKFG